MFGAGVMFNTTLLLSTAIQCQALLVAIANLSFKISLSICFPNNFLNVFAFWLLKHCNMLLLLQGKEVLPGMKTRQQTLRDGSIRTLYLPSSIVTYFVLYVLRTFLS